MFEAKYYFFPNPQLFICMKSIKLITLLGICVSLSTSANSQGFKDRFFHSLGYTAFLDVFQLPSSSHSYDGSNRVETLSGFSIITYAYKPRINIVNLDDKTLHRRK